MSDFDFYRLFKTLHIVGVVLLAMGIGVQSLAGPMLPRLGTVSEVRVLARLMVMADNFVILPALVIIMGFGYATAGKANIDVNVTWLLIAQVLFYIAVAVSLLYLRRASRDLLRAAEAAPDGPVPASITALVKNPGPAIGGTLLTVIFFVIIYLMVAKPQW